MKKLEINSNFEDCKKIHKEIRKSLIDSKVSYADGIMTLSVLLADLALACEYTKPIFLSQFSEFWDVAAKLKSDSTS